MLISRENLAILVAGAKNFDSCFANDHVKIDPEKGKMWATNGHSLYCTNLPNSKEENFPDTGSESAISSKECILIPIEALEKAEKNIPKKTMPILENIQILTDEKYHHLITTDLKYTQDIKVLHSNDLQFADVDSLLNHVRDQKIKCRVLIGLTELETLVKILKKHGANSVELGVTDQDNPIEVKARECGEELCAWVMPYKSTIVSKEESERWTVEERAEEMLRTLQGIVKEDPFALKKAKKIVEDFEWKEGERH